MHYTLLYRMHHIIPFSTFHFQTAMNFLFLRLAPVENAHHSSAAAKRLYQSGPAERRSAGPIFTAHSGSVPVRGAESGCLIPRDVDPSASCCASIILSRSASSACSASNCTEQHQILLCDI